MAADSLTEMAADPLGRRTLAEAHVQLEPGGGNQTSQRRNRRLAGAGLVGAHHALGRSSPTAQFHL